MKNLSSQKLLRRLLAVQCGALLAATAWSQVAPTAPVPEPMPAKGKAPKKPVPVEEAPAAAESIEEETIMLSPFEVVSDTKGYYSANTMSGTRFNTKLEDLASSMSIMTKEQMSDFAMLDINDIFLYTGNAEGTGTYTEATVDRAGSVADNVQLNPGSSNRIRGLTSANVSFGNFEVSNRMPIDPMLTEGVEVSRGPNANVFGLGNAGGTINQVPVSANLSRQKTRIELRADSYEGWRTLFDHNMVLKKNVLAIRVSGAQQHEGFVRKPSGVETRRLNAMIKFQPFKYTTISASAIDYKMHGNRPNFLPPRDYVSNWVKAGRPAWNPTTSTYTLNGVTYGPFTTTNDAGVPDYFIRPNYAFQRSNLYVDQGGIAYWGAPVTTSAASPFTSSGTLRLQFSGPGYGQTGNATTAKQASQPLFATIPVVTDKSIYDWSGDINLSSVNKLEDSTKMYLVQLDQVLLNTSMQNLTLQGAFLTENNDRYQRTPIGNAGNGGVSGQLFIDVNSTNLDGTPNPFFGRPFIGVGEPRTVYSPLDWKTYRGQFSYRLDLSQEKGVLKWLGTHQLAGYMEHKSRIQRAYVYRDVLTSDHTWTASLASNTARANQSANGTTVNGVAIPATINAGQALLRNFTHYYVGDGNGSNIDYAPGDYEYGAYNYHYGTTGAGNFKTELANIGQLATTDGTGGANNSKVVLKTRGAVMQSQFFKNQIILMGGLRTDELDSSNGAVLVNLINNNTEHDFAQQNGWNPASTRLISGKTKTYSAVVRPLREISFITRASESSGVTRQAGQFLRSLQFSYIHADNFVPQIPAIDLQERNLGNTVGTGDEYGMLFNLFDNKLTVRTTRYENKQLRSRDGDANVYTQRLLRLELDVPNTGDQWQLYDQASAWVLAQNPSWTPAQVKEYTVTNVMKMPVSTYDNLLSANAIGALAAPGDIIAKGTEIELNYNPTKYWTFAASAEEKTSRNANISKTVQDWIDSRMPIWTTIMDPRGLDHILGTADDATPVNWWTTNYGGTGTAQTNFQGNVEAPYSILKQGEGKSRPSIRRYSGRFSTSYMLSGLTDQKILKKFKIGGSVRYESKGAIGYRGLADAGGVYRTLDINQPVYDESHAYYDAFITFRTKLFNDRIGATFQLNCRNIQESGRLQPLGVNPDGSAHTYRIVDPRLFVLTATFDL